MEAVVDMRTRTKKCSTCKKWKPLDNKHFHRRGYSNSTHNGKKYKTKSKLGFQSQCIECKKLSRPNRQNEYRQIKTRRTALFEFVAKIKENSPCTDCGEYFPYFVMEFDHRDPRKKVMSVAKLCNNGYSKARVLLEIAKCDLVCANCHRIRTWGHLYD